MLPKSSDNHHDGEGIEPSYHAKVFDIENRDHCSNNETPSKHSNVKISRVFALAAGIVTLGVVAFSVYFFLDRSGITIFAPQSGGGATEGSGPPILLSEIANHGTTEDCWMAFHGQVYDMTEYAPKHPGGARIVYDSCGTDATSAYSNFHGESLLRSVSYAYVGYLATASEVNSSTGASSFAPDTSTSTSSSQSNPQATVGGSSGTSTAAISLSEVSKHGTTTDCWMAFHGQVYDMTEYAPNHPGGARIVYRSCGTDATVAYGREHRESLLRTVSYAYVGTLVV